MAASTANRYNLQGIITSRIDRLLAASTHIYQGTLVATNSAGYEVALSDAANIIFDGFAEGETNNTGAAGAASVPVTTRHGDNLGIIEIDAASPDQSWINAEIAAADDHTGALLVQTTHVVRIGRCVAVPKTGVAGRIWVDTGDIGATSLAGS